VARRVTKRVRILQITDTHVGPPGFTAYGVDPRARLEACVADINAHHGNAALCLVTGDLVNEGSPAEYENLVSVLRALLVPVRVIPGNHDARAALLGHFPDTPADEHGYMQSTVEVPGGRVLLLDTLAPGRVEGELCARRLEWLARTLAAREDSIYIFMHHPPVAVGIEFMDGIALANRDAFWGVLAPHRERVRLIAFGHLHRPVSGVWNGIALAGCPSTAHQIALELGARAEPRVNVNREPPCYAIFDFSPSGVIVHQQRYTENWKFARLRD
jgi:3',5'-cyclic-AMP phosphodiesterase